RADGAEDDEGMERDTQGAGTEGLGVPRLIFLPVVQQWWPGHRSASGRDSYLDNLPLPRVRHHAHRLDDVALHDPVHHLHARDDLAEDRVIPDEAGIVLEVDEPLRVARVVAARAHAD